MDQPKDRTEAPRCKRCDGDHTTSSCPYPGPTPLLTRLMGDLLGGQR